MTIARDDPTRSIAARGSVAILPRAALLALGLWFLVALLVTITPITDQDLGWHIALGRVLEQDFGAVRTLLLGQDPSVTAYAYSYWLYQVTVASLFDHVGPGGIVFLRIVLVLGALALALVTARRLGASVWSRAVFLAFGVLMSSERFVDRPDVFSHLAWIVALWILLFHRHGRFGWLLLPLQVLWVNTHHHYTLLPAAAAAFLVGDLIDRRGHARRGLLLLGLLFVATLIGPAGPGAWRAQWKLAGVLTGQVAPIPLRELIGSYAGGGSFLALWVFRIGAPLCLAALLLARRRVGTGAVLAFLIPFALGVLARRAISLFGMTAIALVPVTLEELLRRLPAATRRAVPIIGAGTTLLLGLVAIVGLSNGRILLAQDKEIRVGTVGPPLYPALGAARFVKAERLEGPIFHNPTFAGAILMENGTRLSPFLDPRWCGTADHNATYVQLVSANDESVGAVWEANEQRYGFEAVILDFYEMPALLRYLSGQAGWALVFADHGAALFCRRNGRNTGVIDRHEPELSKRRAQPDPERDARLAQAVTRFLSSHRPSPLTALSFPWRSFHRADFAMQTFRRAEASAAYLELLENERGSLRVSRHRRDILGNVLWCLAESDQYEAVGRLAAALSGENGTTEEQRRGWDLTRARALLGLRRFAEVEPIATAIAREARANSEERWSAWITVAGAREGTADHLGAVDALRSAATVRPRAPETYFYLGSILDGELHRTEEALEAYRTFRSLGGSDPRVDQRIGLLSGQGSP